MSVPAFLRPNSKVILAPHGIFRKGFLLHLPGDNVFHQIAKNGGWNYLPLLQNGQAYVLIIA